MREIPGESDIIRPMAEKRGDKPWSVFGRGIEDAPLRPRRTMVSLFAGCGGCDLGFRFAGFKTLWANDIDPHACATYRANIGDNIVEGDIRDISLPDNLGRVDVMAACFPCQPFSNAGAHRGVKDKINGKLNEVALEAAAHFKPSVVLYENVRGMLCAKDGKKRLITKIAKELRGLGYEVHFHLIDSSLHRVPQRRIRLFIVGVDKNRVRGEFSFPDEKSNAGLHLGAILRGKLSGLPNAGDFPQLGPQAEEMCERIPEGGSWKDIKDRFLPERLLKIRREKDPHKYRAPNFYRCFARDEIAGTITATFKPENSGVFNPYWTRPFSVREAARIQSFPDWFEFRGQSAASMYRQVGNAVPPRLAYELAQSVESVLCGEKKAANALMSFRDFCRLPRPFRVSDAPVFLSA